jgi:hypothetical protein
MLNPLTNPRDSFIEIVLLGKLLSEMMEIFGKKREKEMAVFIRQNYDIAQQNQGEVIEKWIGKEF